MPTTRAEDALELPDDRRAQLSDWARSGYPREACGLLVGRSKGGLVEVLDVTRARNLNVERACDRYELDPADQLRAEESARERGLDVVGVWHSHPDHPARPSETDRAAAWEGWSYLILSIVAGEVADVRSWRLRDGRFTEERIRQPRQSP